MAIWVVRGGDKVGDAEQEFLDSGSVGIYFGANRDITGMSSADLRLEVERFYVEEIAPESADDVAVKGVVTRFTNQVLTFRDSIQVGDTIVMPRKYFGGHRVARGVVTSEYQWWGLGNYPSYPHRRRVCWSDVEVPRETIGCTWALSNQATIFRIDL